MKRVLVIDDDANVCETFALALEHAGYAVATASSGRAGVESASKERPDLVFLDLKMPDMNGVDTLSHLRKACPEVPVYIVTAFYSEFMQPLRALQAKGVTFEVARKPLTLEEITAIADGVLATSARFRMSHARI